MLLVLGIIILAVPAIGILAAVMDAVDDARFYREIGIR